MQSLHHITTVEEIEAALGRPSSMIMRKQISALDDGCRAVLARCPLAGFGYRDADGVSHTTFIGGTTGFVRVHSPSRISFTLPGGEAHGPVSFVFLLPGVGETLRVNGSVARRKGAETFVDVEEAYVHCAQAVIRSRLWQPPGPAGPAPQVRGEGPLGGPGVAEFLAAAPFLVLSTWDRTGGGDTSPRGDRPVARIQDGRTLVIADRKGNKRADSLRNLLQDDRLSFAALVPGRTGVLHVSGRGSITDDPALLETMALRGTAPHAALLIDVDHAEVTASDAVARSRVWTTHLSRGTTPDLMALAGKHLAANESGPLSRALTVVTRIPGISRVLRPAMNLAYRSGLRKEGYEDVEIGARPQGSAADNPLREVRIAEVRGETPSAVTLVLEDAERAGSFDFRPGQFFTLVTDIDGRPVRRAYSASSAPGARRLEVTVKQVEGGRFSAHVHRNLRAGDRLSVRGPSGSFHVDPLAAHEVVLIAAGSGVTPVMSMIRTLLAAPASGRIALLYSNRSEEEIIFAAELRRLERENPERLSVTHVLTREHGRLDAASVRSWLTGLRPSEAARYYLCGPEGLMDVVRSVLTDLGVPDGHVHQERYASSADTTVTSAPQKMIIEDDAHVVGSAVVEPGQTLLDAGLAAGLPMPYSCTVGNCGDCRVRLSDGEVAMNGPNCLTPEQKTDGYVLTCVGSPLSEVTLDIAEP